MLVSDFVKGGIAALGPQITLLWPRGQEQNWKFRSWQAQTFLAHAAYWASEQLEGSYRVLVFDTAKRLHLYAQGELTRAALGPRAFHADRNARRRDDTIARRYTSIAAACIPAYSDSDVQVALKVARLLPEEVTAESLLREMPTGVRIRFTTEAKRSYPLPRITVR